jgi:hypothetical protein
MLESSEYAIFLQFPPKKFLDKKCDFSSTWTFLNCGTMAQKQIRVCGVGKRVFLPRRRVIIMRALQVLHTQ